MRFVNLSIIFLIFFMGSALAETSINTNSIQTSAINTSASNLDINTVTDFTGNSIKGVNNLFFSSKTFIVQESDGDDIVFQLDNSSGTRKNFLTLDNSAFSVVLGVPLSMSSNQISNLADPDDPQDAATMSWVNENDDIEPDTNASTECGSEEVLTGAGCVTRYSASDDSDSALGNEGANDLSFDTGTGTLTLDRVNQGSLSQNLDGRYPTSDTNTQLDDQPAENTVYFGTNEIRDLILNINSKHSSGTFIPPLKNSWQWEDKRSRSTVTTNSSEIGLGNVFDGDGGSFSKITNYPAQITVDYGSNTYSDAEGSYFPLVASYPNSEFGKVEVDWAADGYNSGNWQNLCTKTSTSRSGLFLCKGNYNDIGSYHPQRFRITIYKPDNRDYGWLKDVMLLRSNVELTGGRYISRARGYNKMFQNLDMNTNQIQNADIEATEGLKIPVGQDAW